MAYLLKYQMRFERNDGTEEEPNIVEYFQSASVYATDADYDKQMAFAKSESYNGEITVEEVPDPEHEPTAEERIAELEAINAELEDAMCEMDAMNEERFAAIEDALCEMDMG